jgi:hypothetical protein
VAVVDAKPNAFSVLIVDVGHHDPEKGYAEQGYTKGGFPSLEVAKEFARRWTRDSVEELRSPGQSPEDLRKAWVIFGEDAMVLGDGYKGSDELDFFITHPATSDERDWQSLDPARHALPKT